MSAQCVFDSDLASVTKVLREFDGCPAVARKMFVDGLAAALSQDGVQERHEYQRRFLSATQNVLKDAQQSAVQKKASCADAEQKARAELESQCATSSEAVKVEQDAHTEAETKAKLLQDAKLHVTRTEREHKKVEEGKERVCKERDQVKQEKAQHDAIADGSFRMLLDGGWEDEEMKSAVIEAVQTHLAACKADEVLIAAAPAALGTKPEQRHAFDTLTVNCISDVFKAQEAKMTQRLAEGEAFEEETCAHALGMWAVADVARDACTAAESHSRTATADLEAASATAQAEAKKTIEHESALAALQSQHVCAGELVHEVVDAIAALERLVENQYEASVTANQIAEESSAMIVDSAADIPAEAEPAEAEQQPVVEQTSMDVDGSETIPADSTHSKMEDCAPVTAPSSSPVGGA